LVLAAACSSPPSPRTASCSPCAPAAGGVGVSSAPAVGAAGEEAVAGAWALWSKIRVNAEKAVVLPAGDPNKGWLDRALESDGRELFTPLSRPEFEPYAATRGEIRARLLFVIKPPTPEDRREAIQFVDRGFAEIFKRLPPRPAFPPASS
jgi:hypothetical protein